MHADDEFAKPRHAVNDERHKLAPRHELVTQGWPEERGEPVHTRVVEREWRSFRIDRGHAVNERFGERRHALRKLWVRTGIRVNRPRLHEIRARARRVVGQEPLAEQLLRVHVLPLTHRTEVGETARGPRANALDAEAFLTTQRRMRVVITGSNRGIGLELVRHFLQRGENVHALCRHSSSELDALASSRNLAILQGVDVSSPDASHRVLNHLDDAGIDILVQNAGILEREAKLAPSVESIRDQLEVNAIGPILLTLGLLPRLSAGSKVMFLTSRMGSIADNSSGGYFGYRMSKAALNAGAVSLARDLAPQGIPVGIVHPGYVQTSMTGGHGDIDAATAAKQIIERIDQLSMERSGRFFHSNGGELPW